jgi:hypothetical protein
LRLFTTPITSGEKPKKLEKKRRLARRPMRRRQLKMLDESLFNTHIFYK